MLEMDHMKHETGHETLATSTGIQIQVARDSATGRITINYLKGLHIVLRAHSSSYTNGLQDVAN